MTSPNRDAEYFFEPVAVSVANAVSISHISLLKLQFNEYKDSQVEPPI